MDSIIIAICPTGGNAFDADFQLPCRETVGTLKILVTFMGKMFIQLAEVLRLVFVIWKGMAALDFLDSNRKS
jgi:hypothetical protein